MENVAVPLEVEGNIIRGIVDEDMKKLLIDSVVRLNDADVDFIVIPCNSVHVFIDELRSISKKPILSIIEETAKICDGVKKVGLLASSLTINQKLHENELNQKGIDIVIPNKKDQRIIDDTIVKIIHDESNSRDEEIILSIIEQLKREGAEKIILGCTELGSLISGEEMIDTLEVLEDAVVEELLNTRGEEELNGIKTG
tara:strand:- start:2678 stop:3274 length:597 start_codon:yes stop_codon:yes gene_type:complete